MAASNGSRPLASEISTKKRSTATPEYLRVPFGYLPLIAGYHFLLFSDNYLLTISGTALLGAGTVIYIRYLHRYYMMQ